jgi:glycosyltransferase involved in cell wall biosynthesis
LAKSDKQELLANAYALLFPFDWPEPFGLVMIEAMACGTPSSPIDAALSRSLSMTASPVSSSTSTWQSIARVRVLA